MTVPWNLLIGPAASLLDTVLKRILPPEKVSEKDRMEIVTQFQLEYEKHLKEYAKMFFDFVQSQYQAVREGPYAFFAAFADMMRMLVRPLITMAWFALYAWIKVMVIRIVMSDGFQLQDVKVIFTEYDAIIGIIILVFWFGDRAFQRGIEALKGGYLGRLFKVLLK